MEGDRKKDPRQRFSKEFKLDAVQMIGQGGKSAAAVARDLGIRAKMLLRWRQELKEHRGSAFPGHGHLMPEEEDLRRLRRDNERLKEENEILKKAIGYFTKREE